MDMLEELYYGNLCPFDDIDREIVQSEEYQAAHREFMKISDCFESMLTEDAADIYRSVLEAHTDTFKMHDKKAFKAGFILGAQIMHTCLGKE